MVSVEPEEVDLGIMRSQSLSVSSGNASLKLLLSKLSNPTSSSVTLWCQGCWGLVIWLVGCFSFLGFYNFSNFCAEFEALLLLDLMVTHCCMHSAVCLLKEGARFPFCFPSLPYSSNTTGPSFPWLAPGLSCLKPREQSVSPARPGLASTTL